MVFAKVCWRGSVGIREYTYRPIRNGKVLELTPEGGLLGSRNVPTDITLSARPLFRGRPGVAASHRPTDTRRLLKC
jgi:hypothetical protein